MTSHAEKTGVIAGPISNDPPADTDNTLDVRVPPERLPKEIIDRIIRMLADEIPPVKHESDTSNPNKDKTNYSALCALQRTSREMYMHVTPYIWREYEGDLLGFVRLFRLLEPIDNDHATLKDAMPRDDRDGHPVDWTYATRIFWMFTFLRKLIYRPIVECDSWTEIAEPVFDKLDESQFRNASGRLWGDLFPALEDVVLDASRYKGYFSAWENIYSDVVTAGPDPFVPLSFSASLNYQDKGVRCQDKVSQLSRLSFMTGNMLPVTKSPNTCIRFELEEIGDGFVDIDDPEGNLPVHGHPLFNRSRVSFRSRTVTWSVRSQYYRMVHRSVELHDLAFGLIDVETLYLAKPQARADHLKTLMDTIFNNRTEWDEDRGKDFNTKWEWLEEGEDGVARCVSCGDQIF